MDVTGDRNQVPCCKEQYCIGTWKIRSMNQGKLEVVKQEMARVNIDILGINGLEWVNLIQMTITFTTVSNPLRRNGVAIIVNKRVCNAVRSDQISRSVVSDSLYLGAISKMTE